MIPQRNYKELMDKVELRFWHCAVIQCCGFRAQVSGRASSRQAGSATQVGFVHIFRVPVMGASNASP